MNPLIRVHTWIFVFFPNRNFPSELEDADRNAPRRAIFSGYMDSIFQAKAPPFSDPRSQGSHHWDCPPFFLPHLFYFSHQIHRSSAISSGLSLLSINQLLFYILFSFGSLNLTWNCCFFVFFSQLHDSLFVCIEVGQSLVVKDPDGAFTVTVFDAHHCPGIFSIPPICLN